MDASPPHPSATLRVVLVDDEELARRLLREYLAGEPGIEVVAECANGFDAVKVVAETKPDVLLLDIQMPKLDGFEVLELIDEPVAVVFVTAYDEYALRAFAVHAADYLLKPVSRERLSEAMARVRERFGTSAQAPRRARADVEALVKAARPAGQNLRRVLVKDGARVHVIPIEAIDCIEAQDDYVSIRSGGKGYLKQQTLADLEGALDPQRFVRIHRSYLLNVDRLARIETYAKDSRAVFLKDGTRLPLSRSGHARLKQLL